MGGSKQSLRKRTAAQDDEIPEDVREYKEKLERETGKQYRYRAPKSEMPSVQELLQNGTGEPISAKDEAVYLVLLVGLFFSSLYAFHVFVSPIV